jgi:predicted extracellular nuclease
MKVRIQTADANRMRVAQTYFLGRYGQLTLSSPEVSASLVSPLINPTQIFDPAVTPTSNAQLLFAAEEAQILVLDDGQDVEANGDNPNLVPYIGCQDTPPLPPTRVLRAGDLAGNLLGILDQGLINTPATNTHDYRLQPLNTASITFTTANPRPVLPPNNGSNFEIVSLNLENFFTTLRRDNGDARGAFDEDELACQGQKLAKAICAMNPDVLGLAELENNLAAITLLVSRLNTECGTSPQGADKWTAVTGPAVSGTVDVIGTDLIKVGFVYNRFTAEKVGLPAVIPGSVGGFNTYLTFNRPSLAQTFRTIAGNRKFTTVMNHWKSKGSDCVANGDPDLGNLAGNCNLTRTSMANAMVAWVASDPTASSDPDFLVMGDLNSYGEEDPVDVLLNAGYVNLVERDRTDDGNGYIFDGRVGTLDYGIATPSFAGQVQNADTWTINSDEPKTLDYENFFNQAGCRNCTIPFRAGDHDPVSFALVATPPAVPASSDLSLVVLGGTLLVLGVGLVSRRRRQGLET